MKPGCVVVAHGRRTAEAGARARGGRRGSVAADLAVAVTREKGIVSVYCNKEDARVSLAQTRPRWDLMAENGPRVLQMTCRLSKSLVWPSAGKSQSSSLRGSAFDPGVRHRQCTERNSDAISAGAPTLLVGAQLCLPAYIVLSTRPECCDNELRNALGGTAVVADSFESVGKHIDVASC